MRVRVLVLETKSESEFFVWMCMYNNGGGFGSLNSALFWVGCCLSSPLGSSFSKKITRKKEEKMVGL